MAGRKVVDETHYNLTYINPGVHGGDNGRVIGYDNAHGSHHRHCLGRVEAVRFLSFEDIEARFKRDWDRFRKRR